MSTREIRQKLFDYIRAADEKKVKAIYTMVENEIKTEPTVWTDEFLEELNKRTMEFEKRKVKGLTWSEVQAQARILVGKK